MGSRNRQTSEERFYPRYLTVSGAFNGVLWLQAEKKAWDCKVIDVSRDGLGILGNTPVKKGDIVEVQVADSKVLMRIVYCHDDLIYKGKFRCGLQRTGSADNLINIFSAAGFLQEK